MLRRERDNPMASVFFCQHCAGIFVVHRLWFHPRQHKPKYEGFFDGTVLGYTKYICICYFQGRDVLILDRLQCLNNLEKLSIRQVNSLEGILTTWFSQKNEHKNFSGFFCVSFKRKFSWLSLKQSTFWRCKSKNNKGDSSNIGGVYYFFRLGVCFYH